MNYIDLTGNRYGRLTVLRYYKTERKRVYWLCRCDCGNEIAVYAASLKDGRTKSCGCWARDRMKEYHRKICKWRDGIPDLHQVTEDVLGETFEYEASDTVLLINKNGDYYIGNYEKSDSFQGWVDDWNGDPLKDITNWMPLPPKEGT